MAVWDGREYGLQANLDREIEFVKEQGRQEVRRAIADLHKPGECYPTCTLQHACLECGALWPCATAVAAGLA